MRPGRCCKRIPGPGAASWRRQRGRAKFASFGRSLGNCCAFARWVRSAKMQTPVSVCRLGRVLARPNALKRRPWLLGLVRTRPNLRNPYGDSSHDFKQPISFPRRVCARVCELVPTTPRGVGGAPTGAPVQRHRLARNNVAGRAPSGVPASLKAGGTRASRRSTVAILGQGPRFHLRHFLRIRAASSSQPGRSAWRAGSPASRARGYEPRPQDATPRSALKDRL